MTAQIHDMRLSAPENTLSRLRLATTTRGACLRAPDPDAWFPPEPKQGGAESAQAVEARRAEYVATAQTLCHGCPVLAECLELALHEEQDLPRTWIHGIRGGKAPWQRANILQYRRRAAARRTGKAA